MTALVQLRRLRTPARGAYISALGRSFAHLFATFDGLSSVDFH
jgi:hypothetical protein